MAIVSRPLSLIKDRIGRQIPMNVWRKIRIHVGFTVMSGLEVTFDQLFFDSKVNYHEALLPKLRARLGRVPSGARDCASLPNNKKEQKWLETSK